MNKKIIENICILGSGGHATSCIDLIESTKRFKIIGIIIKKNENLLSKKFNNYNIIGTDNDYKKILKVCKNIAIGISFYHNLILRDKVFKNLKKLIFCFLEHTNI